MNFVTKGKYEYFHKLYIERALKHVSRTYQMKALRSVIIPQIQEVHIQNLQPAISH